MILFTSSGGAISTKSIHVTFKLEISPVAIATVSKLDNPNASGVPVPGAYAGSFASIS